MTDRFISLAGHAVQLHGETPAAEQMFEFMFEDIPEEQFEHLEASLTLTPLDEINWQVLKGKKQVYRNMAMVDAANFLMGEVVYHLIENNRKYMAIHAALLSDNQGGILMPGESGNGKSSLAIWMTLNGYHYHTDELVLIKQGSLDCKVFTRPFNIKSHGLDAVNQLFDIDKLQPAAARGNFITMIPHRALNPDFIQAPPEISRILFPKFDRNGNNELLPLSRAIAGMELMKTNVIARNLPGHGFSQLLNIVKTVPAFRLSYNHFDALPDLLAGLESA